MTLHALTALESYLREHQAPPIVRALVEREIRRLRTAEDQQRASKLEQRSSTQTSGDEK